MTVIAMVCTKKFFVQEKCAILGPKMDHRHNFGSALRIFLKFCTMKNWPLGHFLLFDWPWSNWARSLLIGSLNSQDMISFVITTRSLD